MRTTKEQLLNQIKAILGDNANSDDAISLYENISDSITDTSDEIEAYKNKITDLENQVKSVETSWREKYTSRFFEPSTSDKTEPEKKQEPELENDYESVTIEDLFND